ELRSWLHCDGHFLRRFETAIVSAEPHNECARRTKCDVYGVFPVGGQRRRDPAGRKRRVRSGALVLPHLELLGAERDLLSGTSVHIPRDAQALSRLVVLWP